MVTLQISGGGVVVSSDSWHDLVQNASNNLWTACVDMTNAINAINAL